MFTQYISQHQIAGGRVRAGLAKIVRQPLDCGTGGVQGEGEGVDLLIFLGDVHTVTKAPIIIPAMTPITNDSAAICPAEERCSPAERRRMFVVSAT